MKFNFKKKYGQNFISDENLIDSIIKDSGIDENSFVIEIGAGAGILTKKLAKIAKQVTSFEIDEELRVFLDKLEQENNNLKIIYGDFMTADVKKIVNGKNFDVVANLPYYITTAIILKLLPLKPKTITIMVQNEVADRLCAKPKTKEYGAMSVLCQSVCGVIKTRIVKRTMFFPVPEVDSAVVKLTSNGNEFDEGFSKFIYNCFMHKRKTLTNNLSSAYKINKTDAANLIKDIGAKESVRAEELSVDELKNLYSLVLKL